MPASSSYLVIVNNQIDTDDDSIWRVPTIESAVHPSFTFMAWRAPKVPREPTKNSRCKSIAGRIFDLRFIRTLIIFSKWLRMQTHASFWLTNRFKTFVKGLKTSSDLLHTSLLKTIYFVHWNQEISHRSALFLEEISDDLISVDLIQAYIERVKFSALLLGKNKPASDVEAFAVIGSRKRISTQARQRFTDADVRASRSRLRRWGISISIHP